MSQQKKYKILFLAPYPIGCAASQRLKYEQYYPHFESNGFQVTTSSFIGKRFWRMIYKPGGTILKIFYTLVGYLRRLKDLTQVSRYDIVYVHLWVTPLGPPLFEYLVCLLAKRVIYDIDDLIFLGHVSKANKMWLRLKGKRKVTYLMEKADHVIVCSDKLYSFTEKINPNVTDISSTINTDIFIPAKNDNDRDEITIGWTGSHSTSTYLHILDNVFDRLSKEFKFKLILIGAENYLNDELNIEYRKWNTETEVRDLQDIDIGVYPLPYEDWILGKSGLKAITFMSLAIPCVATAIGANTRVLSEGETGFLVKTEEEWFQKIKTLATDKALRKKMGELGRKRVEEYYSVDANIKIYLQVLGSVIDDYTNYQFIHHKHPR